MAFGRFVDLFAGAGGFTRGLLDAGWELAFGLDSSPTASATYAANFGLDRVRNCDIRDLTAEQLAGINLIVGGLPSRGYSSVRGSPTASSGELWREFERLVTIARPGAFVLETVPGFVHSPDGRAWVRRLLSGTIEGYSVSVSQLDAADFGVPQHRRRVFVIGCLDRPVTPAEPTHARVPIQARVPWRTIRQAFDSVPLSTTTFELPERWVSFGGERVPGPFRSSELHLARRVQQKSIARADNVPPGGNRMDIPQRLLPESWAKKPSGARDVMGRLEWDKPSVTVRCEFYKPEKGRYLHPQWDPLDLTRRINRSITHWEAARLQTFPDDYLWCGTRVAIGRQIGEATPVLLGEFIGGYIARLLADDPAAESTDAQARLFP